MADYTPNLGNYTELKPFRFWCQKVLPLVYDDTLSYYELLCKVVDYLNMTMEDVDTLHDDVVNLHAAYVQLQTYVNTYFDNLDVQEEINNKLDAMVTSGELVQILSPTIATEVAAWLAEHLTPTTPTIDNTLTVNGAGADARRTGNAFADTYSNAATYKKNDIVKYNGILYRCVSDVDTAEEFDTNNWEATNVGIETKNLLNGALAPFLNIAYGGANLSDCNAAEGNRIYRIQASSSEISNWPSFVPLSVNIENTLLITLVYKYNANNFKNQMIINTSVGSVLAARRCANGTWTAWERVTAFGKLMTANKNYGLTTAALSVLDDLNNASPFMLYHFDVLARNELPANMPTDAELNSYVFTFFYEAAVSGDDYYIQYVFNKKFVATHLRTLRSGRSWSAWESLVDVTASNITGCRKFGLTTQAVTVLSDLDNAVPYELYHFSVLDRSELPAHFPTDAPLDNFVITFMYDAAVSGDDYWIQFVLGPDLRATHLRTLRENRTWSAWQKLIEDGVIECGTGKPYTTLRSAIAEAVKKPYRKVIVYPGTYDLTQEFASEITAQPAARVGIELSNNVHVLFMSGAYVTAVFTNSSDWISTYFNPFFGCDFVLEDLNIEVANCRYAFHDEMASRDVTYHNKFLNCVMKNTVSADSGVTGTLYPQCIGGGLGKYGYIEVIGGSYTSVDTDGTFAELPAISYHNGAYAGCDSKLFFRDVYLGDGNCFRFGYHGESTIKSKVFVNGCSMGAAIIERAETSGSLIDNFDVVEWNNTVRT